MKKLKTMLAVALVAVMGLSFVAEDAMAKSRSGGGSRSRSFSRPKSRPSSAKSAKSTTKFTKTKAKTKAKAKAAAKAKTSRKTAKTKMTPAQQKSLETAKKNGTSFKNKDAATAAFKKNQAGKYPAKYATKPASRPTHIPATTNVGGQNVNINYNAGMGGYGYTNALGAFIMYDMMSDAMMRNRMMAQSHYIVQPTVVQAPVAVQSRPMGFIRAMVIILLGLGVVTLFFMIRN